MTDGDRLPVADAEMMLYRNFFTSAESDQFYQDLLAQIAWQQRRTRFGTEVPRLTAFYGDSGKTYAYSGIIEHPQPWTPTLLTIKQRLEAATAQRFNTVLLNLYRNERDSVAWHSDDEDELGQHAVIASVSFGDERLFRLRHKQRREPRVEVNLPHGSLLLMQGTTQGYWEHAIPKAKAPHGARINLTYRVIRSS